MGTAKQVHDAIGKLQKASSSRALVIDLRNNPGGVVTAALDVASMFLQPGQIILTAKGRTSAVETATVPKNASPYGFKVSILINEKTASASEIFPGLYRIMTGNYRGQTSYGKGLVQRVMPLSGGAGLAITTAFYYTPSGRSIQHPLRNSALSSTFSTTTNGRNARSRLQDRQGSHCNRRGRHSTRCTYFDRSHEQARNGVGCKRCDYLIRNPVPHESQGRVR